jgi:predicted RNA-binding Zn-ribbon protein involved in translation (DUF1610 family)
MLSERLATKIDVHPITFCWLWTGCVDENGYGNIGVRRPDGTRTVGYAHRVAYEETVGPIPDRLEIDHLCRTRSCVNPGHLEAVTHRENARRGAGTGGALRPPSDYCNSGSHHFDEANTIWFTSPNTGKPIRRCRACRSETSRRYYLAHKTLGRANVG